MNKKYYLDTSIWLDFFENRNEPNMPKSEWADKLLNKILADNDKIVFSRAVLDELKEQNYTIYEVFNLFKPIKRILVYVEFTKKQFSKSKDLSKKRNLPVFDALHALIARDNKAIMITRDNHFKKLLDITKYKKPEEII